MTRKTADQTIAKRMEARGLPYEITNAESPMFMLSGAGKGVAVVALWRCPVNDDTRTFVGFYGDVEEASDATTAAIKTKSVFDVYHVTKPWRAVMR